MKHDCLFPSHSVAICFVVFCAYLHKCKVSDGEIVNGLLGHHAGELADVLAQHLIGSGA